MRLDAPQTLTVLSAALSAASPLSTPTEGTFAKSELTDPQTVAEIEYNVNRDGTAVTSLDFQVEDDVAKVLEGWNSDIFRRKGGDGGGDGGDGDGGDGDGHGDGTSGSKSGVSAASKHGPYLPNGERQSGGIPAVFLVDALAIEEEASHKRSNKPQKDGNLTSVTVDFTKLPHGIQYGFLKDTNDSAIDLADTLGLAQLGSAASFMGSGDANNTFDRGLFVVMPNNSILTGNVQGDMAEGIDHVTLKMSDLPNQCVTGDNVTLTIGHPEGPCTQSAGSKFHKVSMMALAVAALTASVGSSV